LKVEKKRVLFICTHNSARSQMAEGFLNALYPNRYEAYSAGTELSAVNPVAVQVMAEVRPGGTGHDFDNVVHIFGCFEKIFIERPE